jgi:hypothetical protein
MITCSIPFDLERSEFESEERAGKREAFVRGFNAALEAVARERAIVRRQRDAGIPTEHLGRYKGRTIAEG